MTMRTGPRSTQNVLAVNWASVGTDIKVPTN